MVSQFVGGVLLCGTEVWTTLLMVSGSNDGASINQLDGIGHFYHVGIKLGSITMRNDSSPVNEDRAGGTFSLKIKILISVKRRRALVLVQL